MRLLLLLPLLFSILVFAIAQAPASFSVDYENDRFMLDGMPFRYISGSIHYFRIHPDHWVDRLKKVRALGFNAIQYYIPWNFHELEEGKYVFDEGHNFTEFSRIAYNFGMYTLLRIGPYVCGEWENGGLPWWLLNKGDMKQRSSDPRFTQEVEKWFNILLPKIKPMLRENYGPVLMVQIENEYGSYDACDKNYTGWLRDLVRRHLGNNVVLYTTDGNGDGYLKCGSIPGVLPTVDFGPQSAMGINNSFAVQRKYLPNGKGPLVNSEFYPGWLLLWGQKTQQLPSGRSIVESAHHMYSLGANINFYMIHGGTNFGFWNGAEVNAPCVTSYDYGAPLSEAGDITSNFVSIRNWIKSIPGWPNPPATLPSNSTKRAYGTIRVQHVDSLTEEFFGKTCVVSNKPLTFEQVDHPMGYLMYYTKVQQCGKNLTIPAFKDYAYVYLDKIYQGTLINRFNDVTVRSLKLTECPENKILYILVENQGRQTYETINDHKGILSGVYLDGKELTNWTICSVELPMDISRYKKALKKNKGLPNAAAGDHGIYFGELDVPQVADTFIDTTGWGKGVVLINGNHLGRYWATAGPQMTLYVPAPFLQKGPNSVMIIELEGANHDCHDRFCTMESVDSAVYTFHVETMKPTSFDRFRQMKKQLSVKNSHAFK